jgi:diadenosine tetraphosphate (Ap4A) HIT family hydrolase
MKDEGANQPPLSLTCELCSHPGGALLYRDDRCRVVLVDDPDYPGFCRVIWNAHVKEMTDLPADKQQHCMRVVLAVESALRKALKPHKINLASFGNMTPHLHWHVIPRFKHDAHFPNPVWGGRQPTARSRPGPKLPPQWRKSLAAELSKSLRIHALIP